jgi:hypothetical protein
MTSRDTQAREGPAVRFYGYQQKQSIFIVQSKTLTNITFEIKV